MKKILISTIALFSLVSCNQLNMDKAEKDGIKLNKADALSVRRKLNPGPDSVVAFLWPSEEYFERYVGTGLFSADDYQEFIKDTSAAVFLAGDLFDEAIVDEFTVARQLARDIEEMEERIKPVQDKLKVLLDKIKDLKDEEKTVKTNAKNDGKKEKAKKSELSTTKKDFTDKGCEGTPDTDECKALATKIAELEAEVADLGSKISAAKERLNEIKDEVAAIFSEKKKVENEELNPLLAEKEVLKKKFDDIFFEKATRLGEVQFALDPHAVFITDEGRRAIRPTEQVNWIKTYVDKASSGNLVTFEKNDTKINIEFREWGEDVQTYKTIYETKEDGTEVLSSKSDIYNLTFSDSEVLEFKFDEKDARGNKTGRIFEFKLQRSNLDVLTRLLGDITVVYRGKVERRGQMKIILTQKGL